MNKMILTVTAKPGKAPEVIAAAKNLVQFLESKHDLKGEAYMQIFGGTVGTFYFIGEYENVASAQAAQAKVMEDKEYWALAQKLSEFVIDPPKAAFLQKI